MILIEITNPQDIIRQRVGRLAAKLINVVADELPQVEKVLIEELAKELDQFGIKANFYSVSNLDMRNGGRLEVSIPVHHEKMIS
ncbi:hypothetical protein [Synechococcus elongatus]|uniref:Cytochrome-c oxidase n=2 Tax=Synechococcus elongatus TaxID=32046 RepID=A0AAN1UUR5_SYNEL|nr:hypothetical protein [Synechococcus elongatus]AZB72864.1 hypothetical protein DOP62_09160 [Synechococcus elongatus PCC 11801]QFZ92490.1 hypothetical protein EKO22_09165 [Synechococcus elongatus PCC 11802]